jgi:hypothetical protein
VFGAILIFAGLRDFYFPTFLTIHVIPSGDGIYSLFAGFLVITLALIAWTRK